VTCTCGDVICSPGEAILAADSDELRDACPAGRGADTAALTASRVQHNTASATGGTATGGGIYQEKRPRRSGSRA
jgi:hypothetical protein